MAYDDSTYRDRGTETGVRAESDYPASSDYRTPDYRTSDQQPTANSAKGYPTGGYRAVERREPAVAFPAHARRRRGRVPKAVLDDIFDDPEHGDPGRDRMAVHAVIEVALLVAVVAGVLLLRRRDAQVFAGDSLDALLVAAAALGLLAIGAGLSLRAGAVNLAVGPVAVASALHYAENGDRGILASVGVAALVATAGGLVIALLVVGMHVPAWAGTLAGALGVVVYIQQRTAPVQVQADYDPAGQARYLFGGMAALAVVGGALGTVRAVRRTLGRFRPVSDPARRRGGLAAVLAGAGLVVSTVLAVLAGVLIAAGDNGPVVPGPGLELTGMAVGAALVGGTSAFGRRGGVFGTLLAVVALTLFLRYADEADLGIAQLAIAGAALAGGLGVTRLVERFGRPATARLVERGWDPGPVEDDEPSAPPAPQWAAATSQTDSWASVLPARPTAGRQEPWEVERWRPGER